ncbi:MAG: hypothetical protein ACI8XZ_004924 [Gammaproteobacteria bacterium]|jgi:hypothetical protein
MDDTATPRQIEEVVLKWKVQEIRLDEINRGVVGNSLSNLM